MRPPARSTIATVLVLTALALCGCAAMGRGALWQRAKLLRSTTPAEQAEASRLLTEGDAAWAGRADPAQLHAAVTAWEASLSAAPSAAVLVKLAQARHFEAQWVHAFLPTAQRAAQVKKAHVEGMRHAEAALLLYSPEFASRVEDGARWEDAAAALPKSAAGALYWYAANLGRWAQAEGPLQVFLNRSRIKGLMERVLDLDPDVEFAAAHRYLGGYFASAPRFAGRDLDKSNLHFRETLVRAPHFWANKVLMAETYATESGDKRLFKRLLQEVLAEDSGRLPLVAPEQALSRKRAEELLKTTSSRF